jgi:hypothetical protein
MKTTLRNLITSFLICACALPAMAKEEDKTKTPVAETKGQASDKATGKIPEANRCQHNNVVGSCPTCIIGPNKKSDSDAPKGEANRPVPGKGPKGPKGPPPVIPNSIVVKITNLSQSTKIPTTGVGPGKHEFTVSTSGHYKVQVLEVPAMSASVAAGQAKIGMSVTLSKSPSTGPISSTLTDQNGAVTYHNLAPGKYMVTL